ncbi:GGDEF domain-containing protein [Aquamicrobium defluvii]|uniref:diguanylate cyclase n=1 Tax=Aquamicrobium defluvii TaxID=69279 RepID=A0A011TC34_9HYPH|nr:diguanylate cyclase [Aquamicrobium defluvii]EXL09209.1 diguanylate cyclase [Aquamicrobium defluvii]EZQ17402.1 diguanylate cyclase [Halopseudomonas bauzanensis]TDR37639.1 diguanylate cyclase (GGDEF)-like protein [Aquamicrobium defluvii]
MGMDSDTLFFAAGICATALALTMLSVWLQNRMDRFLMGWMLGMVLLGCGAVIYSTVPFHIETLTAFGFLLQTLGFVAVYVAARVFVGKRIKWAATIALAAGLSLPVVILILAGLNGLGTAIYNLVAAVLIMMTARLYWNARREAPVSIFAITTLYVLTALSFLLCGGVLLQARSWTLDAQPNSWAENVNAIMALAGITGIGALSLGLNQSRAARRHRIEARTDPLTGILNRRALFDSLALDHLQPADAVVIFDLDNFKSINDRFGHNAGDRILCQFALELRSNLCRGDLAARIGGEEFVMVIRQANVPSAISMAERIRSSFKAQPVQTGSGPINCTASAGIAIVLASDEGFDSVFLRADAALYRAKNNGRDRVMTELQVVA